ncbi:hypothetical protein D918_06744 [Trichuris suis]|nr:hypothetical protein D918_06744 [Trichuris suis]
MLLTTQVGVKGFCLQSPNANGNTVYSIPFNMTCLNNVVPVIHGFLRECTRKFSEISELKNKGSLAKEDITFGSGFSGVNGGRQTHHNYQDSKRKLGISRYKQIYKRMELNRFPIKKELSRGNDK